MTEPRDEQFSQLVDGELTSDETNALLEQTLDDADARASLKEMLALRRMTLGWRTREPSMPVVISRPPTRPEHRFGGWAGLAAAACLGGLLVLGGAWIGGRLFDGTEVASAVERAADGAAPPSQRVTPQKMREVEQVFALHESVAGPLAWYAADAETIRMASADSTQAQRTALAVKLDLHSSGSPESMRSLVVVARDGEPAAIDLPAERPGQRALRLYLMPRDDAGSVRVRFALAVRAESGESFDASLTGERSLNLTRRVLGHLALGESLIRVEAAGWRIVREPN